MPVRKRFVFEVTNELMSDLETLRKKLGARSAAEVVRMLIEKAMKEVK